MAFLTLLGEAGGPARVREKAGISSAGTATLARQPSVARVDQVAQDRAVGFADPSAYGHRHHELPASRSVLLLRTTVSTVTTAPMRVVTEGQE